MKSAIPTVFRFLLSFFPFSLSVTAAPLPWTALPAIPDAKGFAGSFAGLSHGTLLVAGGANFPDADPWEGGRKVWYGEIFSLTLGGTEWRRCGQLPKPSGYGASLTIDDELIWIGGGDASANFPDVLTLRWENDELKISRLPDLPLPLAMLCAANIGRTLYVAGGLSHPDALQAEALFFSLNLDASPRSWQRLEPCPGGPRFLATAGAAGNSFYLFSGASLIPGAKGTPQRKWLQDAWRYTPGQGWQQLPDLPRVAVAAPSPAPLIDGRLLVLGGDDGTQAATPPAQHTGFCRDVLAFDPAKNEWTSRGETPFAQVTTTAIVTAQAVIVPGGESRPGVRTTEVWSAQLP